MIRHYFEKLNNSVNKPKKNGKKEIFSNNFYIQSVDKYVRNKVTLIKKGCDENNGKPIM
jgi:hypothetical protein